MYPVTKVPRLIWLALLLTVAGLVAGCSSGAPEPAHLPNVQNAESAGEQSAQSAGDHAQEAAARPGVTQIGIARYDRDCAPCHGEKGDRIAVAPLQSRQFLESIGQEALVQAVSQGKGVMPGTAKHGGSTLSEGEIKAIVSYIVAVSEDVPYTIPTTVPSPTATSVPAKPSAPPAASPSRAASPAPSAAPSGSGTPARSASPAPSTAATTSSTPQKPPPGVPHRVQGREDKCLECHGANAAFPYPVAHAGRPVESCLWCHQKGGTPPAITHELQGREGQCSSCHSATGILRLTSSHANRRDNSCTLCHETVTPSGTAVMLRVPRVPSNHPASIAAIGCLNCHRPGGGAPVIVPTSHSGLTDNMCLMCHKTN